MSSSVERVTVWDWPVRLVHCLMVMLVLALWWTAEEGMMDWHRRCGLTMLGLIIFRLLWGLMGSWTARFVPMIKRLPQLPSYIANLRSKDHKSVFGHNPMGILSVFVMLAALTVQVCTGLFTVDIDGLESGPLAIWVSFDTGRWFADIHELNFDILSIFISLHIIAIFVYLLVKKDNLIKPMVGGKREKADFGAASVPEIKVGAGSFLVSAGVAAAVVYAVLNTG